MVSLSNPSLSFSISTLFSLGTPFAWKVVLLFYAWGFISLKIPSKVFKGPATPNGYIPLYSANGLQYYFVSLVLFLLFVAFGNPDFCTVGNFAWFLVFYMPAYLYLWLIQVSESDKNFENWYKKNLSETKSCSSATS